jgi:heat shock protein HslJ
MRRPTTFLVAVSIAALALVATACGSSTSSSGSSGTTSTTTSTGDGIDGPWTLTSYLTGTTQTPAASPAATLDLATGGAFAGTTGCNNLSGTWTGGADGAFTITPGPMTQRACVDPAGQAQEQALTSGLPKVTDSALSGTTLVMNDAAGAALFTWARGPAGIVGSYTVTGVNNGKQAVVSTPATSTATIQFGPDGTVSGNTGCNSFNGSYTVDGSSLEINPDVAATMMACESASQQLETQFLTALSEVASWERSGQTVTLRDPAGSTQLTLTAAS